VSPRVPSLPPRGSSGLFVAFEGPEGAGKSTQLLRLAARLQADGLDPVVTREPGGTPAADRIRDVILAADLRVDPLAEFLLYAASRAQHVREVIAPALAEGRIVLTDRFAAASVAYQGYGRGIDIEFVRSLNARVTEGLSPDLTLLFDLDPGIGLARVHERGSPDRLEGADLAFHLRVREGFLAQAAAEPARWLVLDAEDGPGALEGAVWDAVAPLLPERVPSDAR
jgi:dTMP kinase